MTKSQPHQNQSAQKPVCQALVHPGATGLSFSIKSETKTCQKRRMLIILSQPPAIVWTIMDLLDILPPANSTADVGEEWHGKSIPGQQSVSGTLGLKTGIQLSTFDKPLHSPYHLDMTIIL